MNYKMFSVFDSKVGSFARPFFMSSKGEALRAWQDLVNDPQTQFCKHAADFTLFILGEFDDITASYTPLTAPESLGCALEYKTLDNQKINSKLDNVSQLQGA